MMPVHGELTASEIETIYSPAFWEIEDTIYFKNAQWAVTDFGLENIAGPYHYDINKDVLDRRWLTHMAGKWWVDMDAFREAFEKAGEIHGIRGNDTDEPTRPLR